MTKDEITHAEEVIQSRRSKLEEKEEQLANDKKELECLEELLHNYQKLTELVAKQEQQCANQAREIEMLKNENLQLKMEKNELNKMSQNLVKKAEQEVAVKVLRSYMNCSKRKDAKKRGYIKMVILEMIQNAKLVIPDDMQEDLEVFDDADRQVNLNFNSTVGQVIGSADSIITKWPENG